VNVHNDGLSPEYPYFGAGATPSLYILLDGGHLSANCALTVYYLPVYPPYSDYNYGLKSAGFFFWLWIRPLVSIGLIKV
jgi:hypothetical protein